MTLKEELKSRKISQQELSDYMSVSRPTISKKLNNPEIFTAQEIRSISELLKVDDLWAFTNLFK
tara:strand:+ start:231 stop:422 length:192 start_codon:yes stop_codon:yes gene_type:complete